MNDELRPVLMSKLIAEQIGVLDRWTVSYAAGIEGGTGVALVTERELLLAGASRVEWNEPDAQGNYWPTLYRDTDSSAT